MGVVLKMLNRNLVRANEDAFPDLLFLAFWQTSTEVPAKKSKTFLSSEHLKFLGKRGKTLKNEEFPAKKERKQGMLWGFLLQPQPPHTRQKDEQKYGPKLQNLPCFKAFGIIFCPDVCSYFCLVFGGGSLSEEQRINCTLSRNPPAAGTPHRTPSFPALLPSNFLGNSGSGAP